MSTNRAGERGTVSGRVYVRDANTGMRGEGAGGRKRATPSSSRASSKAKAKDKSKRAKKGALIMPVEDVQLHDADAALRRLREIEREGITVLSVPVAKDLLGVTKTRVYQYIKDRQVRVATREELLRNNINIGLVTKQKRYFLPTSEVRRLLSAPRPTHDPSQRPPGVDEGAGASGATADQAPNSAKQGGFANGWE